MKLMRFSDLLRHRYSTRFLFVLLLVIHIFLRVYNLTEINPFGWDQVDNAWAANSILVNHDYPLAGMQAKNNSGIFIGPLYYYLVAGAYFLTGLDPIASTILAMLTSVIMFVTLFFVTRSLFSKPVAFVATGIYAVSSYAVLFDRIQWPVNFIMPLSLLIFYALYKVIFGKEKYLLHLACFVGLSFHTHFTAVYYPFIILLSLPLFPRTRKAVIYGGASVLLFSVFLSPVLVSSLTKQSNSSDLGRYFSENSHGFHLRRFFQLAHDAFIKFDSILRYEFLRLAKYLFVPLFLVIFYTHEKSKSTFRLCYLIVLWFLVPWFIFSWYKGEISDYYFSSTLPIVYIILAYITVWLFTRRSLVIKGIIILFWVVYIACNILQILSYTDRGSLSERRKTTTRAIQKGRTMHYEWGVPESYIYYHYLLKNKKISEIKTFFKPHE